MSNKIYYIQNDSNGIISFYDNFDIFIEVSKKLVKKYFNDKTEFFVIDGVENININEADFEFCLKEYRSVFLTGKDIDLYFTSRYLINRKMTKTIKFLQLKRVRK